MTGTNQYPQHTFLKKDFFQDILRKHHCDKGIVVTEFTLEAALGKGENYSSDIIKVNVEYATGNNNKRTQAYIIKAGLADAQMQEQLEQYDVFHRELVVYEKILPVVQSLLLSIKDKTKLAPQVYNMSKTPRHFIFEDLTLQGYKRADKVKGLNYEEAKTVLQSLAKFHAATAVLYTLDPDSMKSHHFPNIGPDQTYFYPLFTNNMAMCAKQAAKWKGCEKYAEKLAKLEKYLIEKAFDIYTWDENEFNVLTHGDMWINNALFKYSSNGGVEECILLDFSTGYFGSPAIDLAYMFFGSTSEDIKEKEFDMLIHDYHAELVSVLKKLDYKKKLPSVVDLQMELLKKGLVGVMFSTFLIPIRLLEDMEHANLSGLLGTNEENKEFREKMFSAPGYQRRMSYLLEYYDRKGLLEV